MEEQTTTTCIGEEIDLGKYFSAVRKELWKIALLSLGIGFVSILVSMLLQNIYRASAVIAPPVQEKRETPALGILASLGMNFGGATKVEDLESLFKSNDLTVRVFGRHNLWSILYKEKYDPAKGKMKWSWVDRLFCGKKSDIPGEWDAIRAAKDRFNVSINRKAGTVSISFDSPSPTGSTDIVKWYLEEGKNRMQEEALDRAVQNKRFIVEQIGKTADALTRDRLYTLLSQELEQEMMARNREQFGFRVIDSPRIPDEKIKPKRVQAFMLATGISFVILAIYFCCRVKQSA